LKNASDTGGSVRSTQWVWGGLLTALTLLFFLSFFNRFAALRSGNGEFTTGLWLLHGKVPYRDYFSATPPLNTLKAALLLKVFGPFLIVTRAAGVAERVLIAVVLFQWLRRLFAVQYAFTAGLVTIVLSAGDLADPIASYNHDAIMWAIFSGFAASFVLDASDRWRILRAAAASGIFAGLSLITKQTIGLGAAIAVPAIVALLLLNAKSWRAIVLWICGFTAGCAVPVALLAAWLHSLHAWMTFLTMAFLKGPAAKGGHITDFIRRELMVASSNWFLVSLAVIAIACSAAAFLRSERNPQAEPNEPPGGKAQWRSARPLAAGFSLVILAAELLALAGLGTIHNLSKSAVYFVFISVTILLLAYGMKSLRRKLSVREQQFALFAAVSFFVAFFLSLSWPAFEAMALPGLGFLVAAVLEGVQPARRRYVYAVLGCLLFVQTLEKLNLPFGFDGLNESPVRLEVQASSLPQLRGLRLSPDMNAFLESTVSTIATHSTPHDTILTYPEMSLFYLLSDRTYPTLAASHNVDVVNDAFAAEESARILAGRPAVVIYMKATPEEAAHEDDIWRFGKPSGQHRLRAAVEQLTAGYRLTETWRVGQDQRQIAVYVRP
jgi:hypothetical protein